MAHNTTLLALDVGEKRIGVAVADMSVRIASPQPAIEVDGNEIRTIEQLVDAHHADKVIVGYPRNQSGEPTAQTKYVELFVDALRSVVQQVEYQDESLTSVKAEEYLRATKKPFEKGDIDSLAASFILEDYMEMQHGRV